MRSDRRPQEETRAADRVDLPAYDHPRAQANRSESVHQGEARTQFAPREQAGVPPQPAGLLAIPILLDGSRLQGSLQELNIRDSPGQFLGRALKHHPLQVLVEVGPGSRQWHHRLSNIRDRRREPSSPSNGVRPVSTRSVTAPRAWGPPRPSAARPLPPVLGMPATAASWAGSSRASQPHRRRPAAAVTSPAGSLRRVDPRFDSDASVSSLGPGSRPAILARNGLSTRPNIAAEALKSAATTLAALGRRPVSPSSRRPPGR
jgi:hypothetical protein